jgi:2-polyprenyl-3-methyl-5-hydroxy-6-metoxy-1,4-benzoquinol methylase
MVDSVMANSVTADSVTADSVTGERGTDSLPRPIFHLLKLIWRRPLNDFVSPRQYFTTMYEGNRWKGKRSRSGAGSEGVFAEQKVTLLKDLAERYGIRTMLDLGCGDFFWMREIAPCLERYHGIDVVEPLIAANRDRFGSPTITFECLDIASAEREQSHDPPADGEIQSYDLVICFDVIGHLLNPEVDRLLEFVLHPGRGKYLLLTNRRDEASERYLTRPKTRHEGINVQKHPLFLKLGLEPIWQTKAQYPGDFFELYALPSADESS